MSKLKVDLVSDVVCPWCVVGYYRLKDAAANLNAELDIYWHPFELNPGMPIDGEDLYIHFQKKYGMTRDKTDALHETLNNHGKPLGFTFNYPRGNRMRNSFKAHQLLAWAASKGEKTRLYENLFYSYFTLQKDIASDQMLLDIVQSLGLDKGEAARFLKQGEYAVSVKSEIEEWVSKGIHAVPATVFQERYLLSGAQPIEQYEKLLNNALSGREAS